MSIQRQSGFTLIELILVMAISGALAAIAMMGFSTLRGQTQFSDSVERLKEDVLKSRQEALSTIKSSGGTDPTKVTFGKLLTFTPGSSTVQVQTLVTINNYQAGNVTSPTAAQAVTISAAPGDTSSYTIPWGITYANTQLTGPPLGAIQNSVVKVAYVRSGTDGALQTATSTTWGAVLTYGLFAPNGAKRNLNFVDPTGRKAFLTIDPTNNGVSRTFP
jgi:prepilin-type N-terminal cleavage/methylation domain-containing protein